MLVSTFAEWLVAIAPCEKTRKVFVNTFFPRTSPSTIYLSEFRMRSGGDPGRGPREGTQGGDPGRGPREGTQGGHVM